MRVFLVFTVGAMLVEKDMIKLGKTHYVNPGAGVDIVDPFQSIHKDGYFFVGCMADQMQAAADKHGDNKMSYQSKVDVSIVRYKDRVGREDQKDMSPLVCFDFCRTIPEMGNFALIHGRECYCTPYYHKMPGTGTCDLTCPGDGQSTCGGAGMSDMYAMHSCDDTLEVLNTAISAAETAEEDADEVATKGLKSARLMEASADVLQTVANKGGDVDSNDFAQQAKVFAGKLKHSAEAARRFVTSLQANLTIARRYRTKDFTIPQNSYDAEATMRKMKELSIAAEAAANSALPYVKAASPQIKHTDAFSAFKTFESVMDTVERWSLLQVSEKQAPGASVEGKQSTCGGALAGEPLVGLTIAGCAEACYSNAPKSSSDYCVAFNHYDLQTSKSLCFLLKEVTKVWAYDCDYEPSFLQAKTTETVDNKCMTRHSWAQEAPVKPEVTKLPRCFGVEMSGTEVNTAR